MGYNLDTSSPVALMRSLQSVADPAARKILELFLQKASSNAKYFCAGMLDIAKYNHYALNIPLYTHFTSPIRRYADLLVHRQFDSILQGGGTVFFIIEGIFMLSRLLQQSLNSLWIVMRLRRLPSSAICASDSLSHRALLTIWFTARGIRRSWPRSSPHICTSAF